MPLIPTSHIRRFQSTYPRLSVDESRVAMFEDLIKEGEVLPPIEVIAQPDGTNILCEGLHRTIAVMRSGRTEIEATIVEPEAGESVEDCAFRRAVQTATRSALPLTRTERRQAALRLLETRPELSNRTIAQWVGVSHSTINRWVSEVDESSTTHEGDAHAPVGPTPDQVAARLIAGMARLDQSRGLFDYFAPRRMGRHLATALSDVLGDSALGAAQRFHTWFGMALAELETRED